MRTTVRLDDQLLKEAKRLAAESGTTLQAVIEESLRERLARRRQPPRSRDPVRLFTTGEHGTHAGVDLDDSSSLLDAMESTD